MVVGLDIFRDHFRGHKDKYILIGGTACAWLDLTKRKRKGEDIDSRSIKKHKNDVFRLYLILDPEIRPKIPTRLVRDMGRFLHAMSEENVALSALGVSGVNLDEVLEELRSRYSVQNAVDAF